jgi:hypothetical protein
MHKLLMTRHIVLAAGLILTIFLLGASPAKADNFTFTTGNAYIDNIGNAGDVGTHFDILQLTGFTGQTGDVEWGSPQTVAISNIAFTVGPSCYVGDAGCANNVQGVAAFSVTVNGLTMSLSPSYFDTIGFSDDLTLSSASVSFALPGGESLELTSLAYDSGSNAGGEEDGTLYGTFTVTPEPVSMVLFGTFMGAAGILRRRRRS